VMYLVRLDPFTRYVVEWFLLTTAGNNEVRRQAMWYKEPGPQRHPFLVRRAPLDYLTAVLTKKLMALRALSERPFRRSVASWAASRSWRSSAPGRAAVALISTASTASVTTSIK
jgi:hypothetical protein